MHPSTLQSWSQRFPHHPKDTPAHLPAVQLFWHRKKHFQQVRAAVGANPEPQTVHPSVGVSGIKMTELPAQSVTQEEPQAQ